MVGTQSLSHLRIGHGWRCLPYIICTLRGFCIVLLLIDCCFHVVQVLNEEAGIARTVSHVLTELHPTPIEVIVVDGGSTDG